MKELFLYLLDPSDSDRAFVKFNPNDEVVMLMNNFGGLSNLELDALTNVARTQLGMLNRQELSDLPELR
jgi:triose/dihydroxyacetone kinase / FAD-AMP lyase (cyclizing)